jgi:hypothetical protein
VSYCTFRLYRLQTIEQYDVTPLRYNEVTKTWQLTSRGIYTECLQDPGIYLLHSRKENTYTGIIDPIEFSGLIHAYFIYSFQEFPENKIDYTRVKVAFKYN